MGKWSSGRVSKRNVLYISQEMYRLSYCIASGFKYTRDPKDCDEKHL